MMDTITPSNSIKFNESPDLVIDVYKANSEKGCVLFMHGGALLIGSRKDLPAEVIGFIQELGWDVACGEYRLSPKYSIEESVADVVQQTKIMREQYSHKKLILAGYSAGAYLTLLAGAKGATVDGLLPFAGYGDIVADWCVTPSQFFIDYKDVNYCAEWLKDHKPFTTVEELIDLYVYLRQRGEWASYVMGDNAPGGYAASVSPIHMLSANYPKTALVHGTQDFDVPVSGSEEMAKALEKHDIDFMTRILDGFDHDLFIQVDKEEVKGAWKDSLEFLGQ